MNDTVLLLQNDASTTDSSDPIVSAIRGAGFHVHSTKEDSYSNQLFDSLLANSRLVAVLIRPEAHEPLRIARYAHRRAPLVPVFFLTGDTAPMPFDREGAPTPMLRENWTIVDADPDSLIPLLRNSLKSMTQVQRFRTTLDRFNLQLSDRAPIESPNLRKLFASQQFLTEILEQSKDAIISMDMDGVVLSWNQAAEKVFGVTADAAIGQPVGELATDEWPQQLARRVQEVRTSGPVKAVEFLCTRSDGTELFVELAMSLVCDWHDQPIGVSLNARDISERKHFEQLREKLVDELEKKNSNLEMFNSTVAHDLKSPLITIRGFLRLLEKEILEEDMERARQRVDRISKAADHLGLLLDKLLELSRIDRDSHPGEPVSLTEIANQAVSLLALQIAESKAAVEVGDLPVLSVDPTKMLEVFQNLIENALRYIRDQANPRIEIGVREKDTERILFVQDNGIGIDPNYHERVFQPFEQLDPRKGSTGIGLAIVKRVIEHYNGRIWIESDGIGKGTTFCFTLDGVEK